MKLTKVTNHGQTRYRVDLGIADNGKRRRKFFGTKAEAEDFSRNHKEAVRQHGLQWAQRWQSLSVHEQAETMRQLERLHRFGYTLGEAVDLVAVTRRPTASVSLQTVVEDFNAHKKDRRMRNRSYGKIRASVKMFCELTGKQRPIRDITEGHIQDFLDRNGWKPATRRSYLGDLRTLFR